MEDLRMSSLGTGRDVQAVDITWHVVTSGIFTYVRSETRG